MDRAVSGPVRDLLVICALLVLAAPVFAQVAPTNGGANQASGGDTVAEVVVTGTHILQSSAGQAQPVQSISAEKILESGFTDVSSVLQNIPQAGASLTTAAQSDSSNGSATEINLRNLGANHSELVSARTRYEVFFDDERNKSLRPRKYQAIMKRPE